MSTGTKLGLYGLLVAAVFAGGLAIGAAAGPIDVGGGHDGERDDSHIDEPAGSDDSHDSHDSHDSRAPDGFVPLSGDDRDGAIGTVGPGGDMAAHGGRAGDAPRSMPDSDGHEGH